MAELRVKLNILDQEMEIAADKTEYEKAAKLKEQINAVNIQIQELKDSFLQSQSQKVRQSQDDPETLIRCLDLLIGVLELATVNSYYPCLRMCKEAFVLPLFEHKNAEILWRTIKVVALLCVVDKEMLEENYKRIFCAVSFLLLIFCVLLDFWWLEFV